MKSAYAGLSRLDEKPPENISELRALQANCAAAYFRSWAGIPIEWRGVSRRPIPANWHSIGQRSSPYHLAGNRNAAHPVNAILNYAYAALESEIRIKAISEGYDPTLGIMHDGSDGSSKFIFDLMEPERPKVDRVVLDFITGHVFDPGRLRYSQRWRLPAQSGNGADGCREVGDIASRPTSTSSRRWRLGRVPRDWWKQPTPTASGTTGVCVSASVPLRARNRPQHCWPFGLDPDQMRSSRSEK